MIPLSAQDGQLLRGENLGYSIDGIDIVKSVNFNIAAGEMVGLIGPNGAGKSTLLKLLLGILPANSGRVLLQGKPLASHSLSARARLIGYLAQGAKAHWPLAVERVVALGRLPHLGFLHRTSAKDEAAIDIAMQMCEVTAYRNRIATTLSGGEQTLVMLARIFATQPELIFADEPVAALDPYHQLHVMELLRAHASDQRGCVVVLHDLGLAARFCDRLYLFQHGGLFASGTPAEVLTEENLRAVYGIESRIESTSAGLNVTPVRRSVDRHP
jgi:ABC-type cobalamin/Fe3+-siderophores transport system ATPase subunit